jgi:hypothetical protein
MTHSAASAASDSSSSAGTWSAALSAVPGPVAFADRQGGDEQADGGVEPPQAEQGIGEQPGGGQVGAQQVLDALALVAAEPRTVPRRRFARPSSGMTISEATARPKAGQLAAGLCPAARAAIAS